MNGYVSPILVEVKMAGSADLVADQVVWYVIALAILICFAVIITAACVLFCLTKGKVFSGSYSKINGNHDVRIGCK